ncbi:hypothetical protein cce_4320 [Crocosphaera subtropica ATCC 51142]|uniref:Hsp70 family protein n=1 Tax=Crocosphaera subtropica (strain ATCC 51142 / BH68) TaxID=43989 RepID=B1WTF3_CROS5|nr:hypothetical protein [Crocosphaera subtropica]ACB53668.1 hypothetical protein cce_4320 [Crocosphaera subtropica ATCC 51142]
MSDLFLNLGIDFGTSFTKVVVRDTSIEHSWLVTFCEKKTSLNEALVPTKIGICPDGTLIGGLTQSEWDESVTSFAVAIDFIKMRLANLDLQEEGQGHLSDSLQSFDQIDLNTSENLENLCAYYLNKVIFKAQKWVKEDNPELVKNQNIEWSANVGVPVKYFDSKAITRFKKVLRLAWLLGENSPQNIYNLQKRMNSLRKELETLESQYTEEDLPIPCFAFPEIGAGVYSYTVSRQADPGIYMFFDVGSGTIEGSAFRFFREEGQSSVEYYSGEVEPIGVNGLAKQIATHLPNSENEITHDIINNSEWLLEEIYNLSATIARSAKQGEHIANKVFLPGPHWRVLVEEVQSCLEIMKDFPSQKLLHLILGQHLIHKQVSDVILTCKDKIPDELRNQPKLRIFLGGGGGQSEFYRDTIEGTHTAFCQERCGIPSYNVQNVPFPSDFDMKGISKNNFHRFAIAYGLSIPDYQAPEVKGFPKQFADVQSSPLCQPTIPEWGRYPDDHSSM